MTDLDAPILNPVEFAQLLGRDYYTGPFAATEASSSEAQCAFIAVWAQAYKPLASGSLIPRERVDAEFAALREAYAIVVEADKGRVDALVEAALRVAAMLSGHLTATDPDDVPVPLPCPSCMAANNDLHAALAPFVEVGT